MSLAVLPVRTPTLPPATHTNCYRVGDTVVDPASPWPDEQARLAAWVGGRVRRIVLTHHHEDHVGGAVDLARRTGARLCAHRDARLPFPVDERLDDDQVLDTGDGRLRCLHTPGHADGHLALLLEETGDLVAGDLVAGEGTIVLVPPEGHLATYLASLDRVRPVARRLHPAHGPPLGPEVLDLYARHRHMRTTQVEAVLRHRGEAAPHEIAADVYAGMAGVDLRLAALQVRAHLQWSWERGRVLPTGRGDGWALVG